MSDRPGGKTGSGGCATWSESNRDRRERLRQLALETIDLNKDPYFMKNHLGSYECKLCLTLHNNEGSYLAHTQGKKHQQNLARRAAKEAKEAPLQPQPEKTKVPVKKFVKIGRPGYKVTKQRDPDTNQHSLLFQIDYPEIEETGVPKHRFMSAYEQRIEPPDKAWQYLLVAAEPYETIGFKIPSREIDKSEEKFWTNWNKDTKQFFLQFYFKLSSSQIAQSRGSGGPPHHGAGGAPRRPPPLLPPPSAPPRGPPPPILGGQSRGQPPTGIPSGPPPSVRPSMRMPPPMRPPGGPGLPPPRPPPPMAGPPPGYFSGPPPMAGPPPRGPPPQGPPPSLQGSPLQRPPPGPPPSLQGPPPGPPPSMPGPSPVPPPNIQGPPPSVQGAPPVPPPTSQEQHQGPPTHGPPDLPLPRPPLPAMPPGMPMHPGAPPTNMPGQVQVGMPPPPTPPGLPGMPMPPPGAMVGPPPTHDEE